MEQNHELPSSFQETERCLHVCRSGCERIAFRHRYLPNALFRMYFVFHRYGAKLLTVQTAQRRKQWLSTYPNPVAAYLAAEEAKDADALSRCFTEDGTVHDERQDYPGRDSIRLWKQEADAKYRYGRH